GRGRGREGRKGGIGGRAAGAGASRSALRPRGVVSASVRRLIDHAVAAMKTASPVVATKSANGARVRNGATVRDGPPPATARVAISTAGTVLEPSTITVAAAHPGPVRPIESSSPYKTGRPGGWPWTCTG